MTHRDDRLFGEIDGVPFYFKRWSTEPGRRTHTHEFYGSDVPYVEDLGKAAYRLNADIFLIGPDYNKERDKLRAVFESPGPYRLVDPYRGPIMVRQASVPKLDESIDKDGMVQIGSLSLVEAGNAEPQIYIVSKGKLTALAGIALEALALNTKFSIKGAIPGVPSTSQTLGIDGVLASIMAGLNAASSLLRTLNGRIDGQLGKITQLSAALDRFDEQLDDLINTPQALMSALNGLVDSTLGVLKTFKSLKKTKTLEVEEPEWPVVETAANVIMAAAIFETAPVDLAYVPEGPQRAIERAAHHEITLQTRAAGVISGADVAGSLSYSSGGQALAMLDLLADGFNTVLSDPTLHPETYEAIAALRSTTTTFLLDQAAKLPRVETLVLPAVTPGLVLAWHLYGDPARAREIARRNGIDHCGFIPAHVSLEVLADA